MGSFSSIEAQMVGIVGAQAVALLIVSQFLTKAEKWQTTWVAPLTNLPKRRCELWFLTYGVVWILAFFYIVATQAYERFDATTYDLVCFGLASPLYLQPIFIPSLTGESFRTPWYQRYSLKANLWLFVFGFTGNYWYTHYFYSVLGAQYSMPAHRLNNVPIAMFGATHFYFTFYHALSNCVIRRIRTGFEPTLVRHVFLVLAIISLCYVTAFAETLTISSFPYYSFDDRDMAYTLGSAFYGLYFVVSFPAFFVMDELPPGVVKTSTQYPLSRVLVEALAASMAVLYLLDFARTSCTERSLYVKPQSTLLAHTLN